MHLDFFLHFFRQETDVKGAEETKEGRAISDRTVWEGTRTTSQATRSRGTKNIDCVLEAASEMSDRSVNV